MITPAMLTITAEDKVIYKNDPLPDLTATFSGFVYNDDSTDLTELSYTIPDYTGSPGLYDIIPFATSTNYDIESYPGVLYVNPSGPGTKHIIPKFICVDENPDGTVYTHIAKFKYENKNAHHVFIPIGEDNILASEGNFDDEQQPELFVPGGGIFYVPFDGSSITWTVASYNHQGQKTASSANGSSGSRSCNKSDLIEEGDDLQEDNKEFRIYPNPTGDKAFVELNNTWVSGKDVKVYDRYGRICHIEGIQSTDQILEIDLSAMLPGLYFIAIPTGDSINILRVIKK